MPSRQKKSPKSRRPVPRKKAPKKTAPRKIPPKKTWEIQLLIKKRKPGVKTKTVKNLLKKILNDLASEPIPEMVNEVSIVFTDDREIHDLNRSYRGKDKPTDVLSFSQLENSDEIAPSSSLGDIVISLDTTLRQAKEYRVTPDTELLRLLIHGLLHLLGYDHEKVSAKVAQAMRRKEEVLMRASGVIRGELLS